MRDGAINPSFVLDASAAMAWFFDDERDATALVMAEAVAEYGALVPALFRWEMQNALLQAVRRGRIVDAVVDERLDDLDKANVVVDGPGAIAPFRAGVSLARRYGLTPYDAAYLELATRAKRPLMTRNARLAAAAGELGLLWEPPRPYVAPTFRLGKMTPGFSENAGEVLEAVEQGATERPPEAP